MANPNQLDPHEYAERYKNRIKPCPFCGKPPEVWGSGDRERGLMIHCISEDGCPNPSTSYYEHETALAVWNRRVAAPDLLDAAEQCLDDMGENGYSVCEQAKQMLRDAIAKAKLEK